MLGRASGLGGGDYERTEARRVMSVRMGVIEGVRPVKLEGTNSPIGTVAGAAVGGIAGSSVGGGKGANIAAVVGAVVVPGWLWTDGEDAVTESASRQESR